MLTIYALFVTPFVLVFSECSYYLENFELFVDICFSLDIILNFLKLEPTQKEIYFKQYRIEYVQGTFLFDCIAALPGLFTLESNKNLNFVKLFRFIHWNRFFDQINFFTDKILMGWLGYTRQKVSEYVDFIRLEMIVILLTHLMACMWIVVGRISDDGWVN